MKELAEIVDGVLFVSVVNISRPAPASLEACNELTPYEFKSWRLHLYFLKTMLMIGLSLCPHIRRG